MNRGLKASLLVGAGGLAVLFAAVPAFAKAPQHVQHVQRVPHLRVVPGGVRIAGVRVGGLTPSAATAAVERAFATPLPLSIDGQTLQLHPAKLASAYIEPAVAHAMSASAGTNIHLVVSVHGAPLRTTAAALERRFDTRARDASLSLVKGTPHVNADVTGRRLDQMLFLQRVAAALTGNVRLPVKVPEKVVKPTVTEQSIGPMILINRETNHLTLFHANNTVWRVFSVATGQSIYPTPAGALLDRRQVDQPDVVSADAGRLGGRPEPGAAWAGQPARHALDGPVGARDRDPRHRRAELDRVERLSRMRPDAGR